MHEDASLATGPCWLLDRFVSRFDTSTEKIRALLCKKTANRHLRHLKKSVCSKSAQEMIYFWTFFIRGSYTDYQKPSPDLTHEPRPWRGPSVLWAPRIWPERQPLCTALKGSSSANSMIFIFIIPFFMAISSLSNLSLQRHEIIKKMFEKNYFKFEN